MREILFRGKRKDNGEWVEGLPSYNCFDLAGEITDIEVFDGVCSDFVEVIPESVGQFTGRVAEEEKKIFEGDKCILTTFNYNGHDYQHEVVVEYSGGAFYFVNDEKEFCMCVAEVGDTESDVVIIGNIHGTDLLKGEDAE
ncbi:YopX family protein [Anaerotignum sp. MB30-C6]|uniref:YopX family protein n=1 Tax=Anaerotignum sp. MB30-C6 TaxID=3070814 RepID=UPI0027DAB61A|nr:YopX family protein [Anaerotignum sp. MB30-C6]WMI81920.1 YopX family protein [Anaerotignum sp. MB30-C6]